MVRRFSTLLAACAALFAVSCGFLSGLGARPTVVVNLMLPTATAAASATPTPLPPSPTPAPTSVPTRAATATATRPAPTSTRPAPTRTATPTATRAAARGTFEVTAFSKATTADAEPVDPQCEFPAGTERVYATYRWNGMTAGETYQRQWYLNGQLNTSGESTWPSANGRDYASLSGTPTLYEGLWELRVLTGGRVLSRDYFVNGPMEPTFGPITLAPAVDEDFDLPVKPSTTYKEGVEAVYGIFPYAGIPNGATWARAWFRDGVEELSKEAVWDDSACAGTNWVGIVDDVSGLEAGSWELVLYLEGEAVQWASFIVERVLPVG